MFGLKTFGNIKERWDSWKNRACKTVHSNTVHERSGSGLQGLEIQAHKRRHETFLLFFRSHYMIFLVSTLSFTFFFLLHRPVHIHMGEGFTSLSYSQRSDSLEAIALICSLWLRFCKLATNPIKWLIALTITSQWLDLPSTKAFTPSPT